MKQTVLRIRYGVSLLMKKETTKRTQGGIYCFFVNDKANKHLFQDKN